MRSGDSLLKSPLVWAGSKQRLCKYMLPLIPRHQHYVEVFAGSLAFLFAKRRSRLETINDKDGEVVNFWLMIRDRSDELIEKVAFTPYSRELFEKWRHEEMPEDPIERAARWFFLYCASFAGYGRSWSYLKIRSTQNVTPPERYRRYIDRIEKACQRLSTVQIECTDFRDMLERFGGSANNFLYLDPPYYGLDLYNQPFGEAEHFSLANSARQCKAAIMLSYYDHPMIRELYERWEFMEIERVQNTAYTPEGGSKAMVTELLIMNYHLIS